MVSLVSLLRTIDNMIEPYKKVEVRHGCRQARFTCLWNSKDYRIVCVTHPIEVLWLFLRGSESGDQSINDRVSMAGNSVFPKCGLSRSGVSHSGDQSTQRLPRLLSFITSSLAPDRPQIPVEPVEALANCFRTRKSAVPTLVDHVLFVVNRRAEKVEERTLRRLQWESEIIPSV
jgi:hypothetical protein